MSRHRILLAAFVLLVSTATTFAQAVKLNWSEQGGRFWFRNSDKQFVIVDAVAHSKSAAFDQARLIAAFTELGEKNASGISIGRIAFTKSAEKIEIYSGLRAWVLDTKSYELARIDASEAKAEKRLFLPPRPSGASEVETQISVENRLKSEVEFVWISTDGRETSYGRIKPGATARQHTYVGHIWLLKSAGGARLGCFAARADDVVVIDENAVGDIRRDTRARRSGRRSRRGTGSSVQSPNREWTAFAKGHDVWIRSTGDTKKEHKLSSNGTDSNSFQRGSGGSDRADVRWSPDSRYMVAFRTKLLWHNDFYKVAVADCGCHDNRMDKIWWNEQWMGWPIDESYKRNSNMENAHLMKGDLMLLVGELDHNVDPATTTQVVGQLIKHNKDFEFVLVVGAGHGSAETRWGSRKRLNFLKRHLLEN